MRSERRVRPWIPAGILALGCLALLAAKRQVPMALPLPLARSLPKDLLGYPGADVEISASERKVSGVSDYVLRVFGKDSTPTVFSTYVGYYEAQAQGKTIHSPKNCLPGAGWEPVEAGSATVFVNGSPTTVNRYILENRGARVLVLYWYQGRGRVSWNEYRVKWELLRDKASRGRSEEALVRVVVPIRSGYTTADSLARTVAARLIPAVFLALPEYPGRQIESAAPVPQT
jgi:EpsI family protein